jgi:hypothetical protein
MHDECVWACRIRLQVNSKMKLELLQFLVWFLICYGFASDHYIREFETFSCLKLIYGPQQHGLMFGSSYLNHLDMSS